MPHTHTQDHVPDREAERRRIESMNPNPKLPLVRGEGMGGCFFGGGFAWLGFLPSCLTHIHTHITARTYTHARTHHTSHASPPPLPPLIRTVRLNGQPPAGALCGRHVACGRPAGAQPRVRGRIPQGGWVEGSCGAEVGEGSQRVDVRGRVRVGGRGGVEEGGGRSDADGVRGA